MFEVAFSLPLGRGLRQSECIRLTVLSPTQQGFEKYAEVSARERPMTQTSKRWRLVAVGCAFQVA